MAFLHIIGNTMHWLSGAMSEIQPSHTVIWERKTHDEATEVALFLQRLREIRCLNSLDWSGEQGTLFSTVVWQPLFDQLKSDVMTIEELAVWCQNETVSFCQALFEALIENTTVRSLRIVVSCPTDSATVLMMHRDIWTALNTLLCTRKASLKLIVEPITTHRLPHDEPNGDNIYFLSPPQDNLQQWSCVQRGGLAVGIIPTAWGTPQPAMNLWSLNLQYAPVSAALRHAQRQFLQQNAIRTLTTDLSSLELVHAIWTNTTIQYIKGLDLFQTDHPEFDATCLPNLRAYIDDIVPRNIVGCLLYNSNIWPQLEHIGINNANLSLAAEFLASSKRPLVSLELYMDEELPMFVNHVKQFARALIQTTITHLQITADNHRIPPSIETFMLQCLDCIFTKQACTIRSLVLPRWYLHNSTINQLCTIFAQNKSLHVVHIGFCDPGPADERFINYEFESISAFYGQLLTANPRMLMAPGALYSGDEAYYPPSVVQTVRQRQTCFILQRHAWQLCSFVFLVSHTLRHHPLRNSLVAFASQLIIMLGGAMPIAYEQSDAYDDVDNRGALRRMWIIQTPYESTALLQRYPLQLFDVIDSVYVSNNVDGDGLNSLPPAGLGKRKR